MSKPGWDIGDVVLLKSGGPKMTVSGDSAMFGPSHVVCIWFVDEKRHEEVFPVQALTASISVEPSYLKSK